MSHFTSTKVFDGYSTVFRQWRASSHCRFLHGYALKFKVFFSSKLDDNNWVCDFGCFKANGVKDKLKYWFDHTTLVSSDDPQLKDFQTLEQQGLIQLRILNQVSVERFAEFVGNLIQEILDLEPSNTIIAYKVICYENDTNAAQWEA